MKTDGLVEVILYVEDMGSQVRFYRDTLGLRVSWPADREEYRGEYWVTFETGACTLALHGGGRRQQGKDAPKIVFGVRDVRAARDELLHRGVPLGEVRSPAPGVSVADGTDPEGNRFSIESHPRHS